MTTSFGRCAAYIMGVVLSFSCRGDDRVEVIQAPLEHVEIGLAENGYLLSFDLPSDDWRYVQRTTSGLSYSDGARSLELKVLSDGSAFAQEAAAFAQDEAIRAFRVGTWPFVGIVVTYRGPPDEAMLTVFIGSFRLERR